MGNDGWYTEGPTKEDLEQAKRESAGGSARRFFLRAEETKHIIMLDDVPFSIWEHNPTINGEFWHYFTCIKGINPEDPVCPMCMSRIKRMYTGYITILDATGWKDKKGNLVRYNRQLFPMTLKTLKRFNVAKDKKTSLVGAQFEITRTSSDAVKVGDMWDFEDYVDPFKDEEYWFTSKLQKKKMPPEPFNYKEIFAPMSSAELKSIASGAGGGRYDGGGGGESSGGGDNDELY